MRHKIWKKILAADHVVITMHRRPDGDALGSALALYNMLLPMKKVSLYNASSEIRREFVSLPGAERIKHTMPPRYELMVVLDTGSFSMVETEKPDVPIINIDHHVSNEAYGELNLVDPGRPSCAEVLFDLFEANEVKLNRPAALCLYAGLVSDTQFFATDRVDGRTFETAQKLLAFGVSPFDVAKRIRQNNALSQLRLQGEVYSRFELFGDGRIATVVIDEAMQKRTGSGLLECEHIADDLLGLVSAEVAVMIYEVSGKGLKVSLRGKGSVDLSELAKRFGGGGHPNAAGIFLEEDDARACEKKLVEEVRRAIDE